MDVCVPLSNFNDKGADINRHTGVWVKPNVVHWEAGRERNAEGVVWWRMDNGKERTNTKLWVLTHEKDLMYNHNS